MLGMEWRNTSGSHLPIAIAWEQQEWKMKNKERKIKNESIEEWTFQEDAVIVGYSWKWIRDTNRCTVYCNSIFNKKYHYYY